MAALIRFAPLSILAALGCDDLQGRGGPPSPLVSFRVHVTGDLDAVKVDPEPAKLQIALVWGRQWLVEPICVLPPDSPEAAAVIAAGCRDPLGFVPARVAANAPVDVDVPTQIDLFTLPAADVMVGDVTARVAYASVVVYDDRDGDGTLLLRRPNRPRDFEDHGEPEPDPANIVADRIYGASFVTMTEPDQRVAFREGAFSAVAAFYPRAGCGEPPPAFSVLAAGGFTVEQAIAAQLAGRLPSQDPATCAESAPEDATVTIALRAPDGVRGLGCTERSTDSSVRYRDPVDDDGPPDLTDRVMACVRSPSFGEPSDTIELVVSGRPTDACVGLTHYVLVGCRSGVNCEGDHDSWDRSGNPPVWWPCD